MGPFWTGRLRELQNSARLWLCPEEDPVLSTSLKIAYSYVNEVSDHLHEGQEVKVKVIGIDQANRINLSIKQVAPPPPRPQGDRPRQGGPQGGFQRGDRPPVPRGTAGARPTPSCPVRHPRSPLILKIS